MHDTPETVKKQRTVIRLVEALTFVIFLAIYVILRNLG